MPGGAAAAPRTGPPGRGDDHGAPCTWEGHRNGARDGPARGDVGRRRRLAAHGSAGEHRRRRRDDDVRRTGPRRRGAPHRRGEAARATRASVSASCPMARSASPPGTTIPRSRCAATSRGGRLPAGGRARWSLRAPSRPSGSTPTTRSGACYVVDGFGKGSAIVAKLPPLHRGRLRPGRPPPLDGGRGPGPGRRPRTADRTRAFRDLRLDRPLVDAVLRALRDPSRALDLGARGVAFASSLAKMTLLSGDPPTRLARPLSGRRRAAFSRPIPLAQSATGPGPSGRR